MTHAERVLEYMKKHGGITSYEAFSHLGVTRLSACIFCLRKAGYNIVNEKRLGKNQYGNTIHYVCYKLLENE